MVNSFKYHLFRSRSAFLDESDEKQSFKTIRVGSSYTVTYTTLGSGTQTKSFYGRCISRRERGVDSSLVFLNKFGNVKVTFLFFYYSNRIVSLTEIGKIHL